MSNWTKIRIEPLERYLDTKTTLVHPNIKYFEQFNGNIVKQINKPTSFRVRSRRLQPLALTTERGVTSSLSRLVSLDGFGYELYESFPVLFGVAGGYAVHVASVLDRFRCLCGLFLDSIMGQDIDQCDKVDFFLGCTCKLHCSVKLTSSSLIHRKLNGNTDCQQRV